MPRSPYRTSALPPPTARASHRDDALFKWQLWALWFDWALCGLRFVTAFRKHEQSLDLVLSLFLSVMLTTTIVLVARQWARARRARAT